MIYDYIATKPELDDDLLAHYGIKGMKWRKRLGQIVNKAKNTYYHLKGQRYEQIAKSRRYDMGINSPQLTTNGRKVGLNTDEDFWTGRSNHKAGQKGSRVDAGIAAGRMRAGISKRPRSRKKNVVPGSVKVYKRKK